MYQKSTKFRLWTAEFNTLDKVRCCQNDVNNAHKTSDFSNPNVPLVIAITFFS